MKNISKIILVAFFAISSIAAETKQECTMKAMDTNQAERKECDKKKDNKEQNACKKASTEKLTAAKHACAEIGKK
jgi:hypothetical protein